VSAQAKRLPLWLKTFLRKSTLSDADSRARWNYHPRTTHPYHPALDVNSLHPIEKAISEKQSWPDPLDPGKSIRIFFPELSQERRQEFVKIIRKMAEDGRVAIRHVRRDAMTN